MNSVVFCDLQHSPHEDLASMLRQLSHGPFDNLFIDPIDVIQDIGALVNTLESTSIQRSKNLLLICFIDGVKVGLEPLGQSPENYVNLLKSLVCSYPEVTFRFVERPPEEERPELYTLCPESFIAMTGIPAIIREFDVGQRDLFDSYGLRFAIRAAKWKDGGSSQLEIIATKLREFRRRARAYVLEDEWDYAELVGYCAFRSGRYQVCPILIPREIQADMGRFRLGDYLSDEDGGVFVHAWDIRDWKGGKSRSSFHSLQEKKIERMLITGAWRSSVKLKDPKKWRPKNDWLGWKPGRVPTLRGLPKPLGWIHDIREHGLLPEWVEKNGVVPTFLDGIETSLKRVEGHHSARLEAQEMAQRLLNRSHSALRNEEPLMSAVFSLEAIRWLRGYSSTLYLDAVQSLYEAETELELAFGSSGRSSRVFAPKSRGKELDALMKKISTSHLVPREQAPEVKERIWAALRKRYLAVGAFEPAEEALRLIHDAHRERIGVAHRPLWAFCSLYLLKTWVGYLAMLVFGLLLTILVFKAPLVQLDYLNPVHRGAFLWILATPWIVLGALIVIWVRAWPSVALNSPSWVKTVILSILVLGAGNLALLSDPSHNDIITGHRGRAYLEAVGWTCGGALAQVLPNKFIHAHPGPDPPLASLSFGWRGKQVRTEDDPDLNAVEETQAVRTALWLENVVAGWLSFATGLSTIYRRASRG